MADQDDAKSGKDFASGILVKPQSFVVKGADNLDWGMKNRLARIFSPSSGRTVMLAIDHGYFQGPTTGLERVDLSILPLLPSCGSSGSTSRIAYRTSTTPGLLKRVRSGNEIE